MTREGQGYSCYQHDMMMMMMMIDTKFIFKRILTGLNSELSFSKTCCRTKAKEYSLPYYLLIAGGY